MNLPILVFDETLRPGNNHGAYRVGAHNVGVIIDLDAARRLLQSECLRYTFEQAAIATMFLPIAGPRASRALLKRMLDQILSFRRVVEQGS